MIYADTRPMLLCLPLVLAFALQGDSCRRSKAPATTTPTPATAQVNKETKNAMSNKEVRDEDDMRASRNVSKETKTLLKGSWGGAHISLSITDVGASLEYDCAHGMIDQPVELDADGRFDVRGRHEEETGGPPPEISASNEDEPDRTKSVTVTKSANTGGHPARYTGRVRGQKMTLTVTLTDTNRPVGTFSLVNGATPHLRKCLK